MSEPTGAADDVHEPVPPLRLAVHSVVEPVVKVTLPVGVAPEPEPEPVTVAEYVTAWPSVVLAGDTLTAVVLGSLDDDVGADEDDDDDVVLVELPVTVSAVTAAAPP